MSQQFVIPQFIDVESKIFGPITMRQFVTILAGIFLCFIVYNLVDFTLFIFIAVVIMVLAIVVAFIKINGISVHFFMLNFIQNTKNPKKRVWDKTPTDSEIKSYTKKEKTIEEVEKISKELITSSRLAELSLIIDTGGVYKGEPDNKKV